MDLMIIGWVKKFVAGAVAGAGGGFVPKIVSVLPTTGDSGTLYLVKKTEGATYNYYDEYLWVNGAWEQIGTTEIPLDDYLTVDELNAAIEEALAQAKASGEFTPVKGVDYFTDEDKTELVSDVLEALPEYKGEVEYNGEIEVVEK